MNVAHELIIVAFVRSTGGRVRVLLATDIEGTPLHDGEPAVLAEHRPGDPVGALHIEGADCMSSDAVALLAEHAGSAIVTLIESALDETGMFDGSRMLGRPIELMVPVGTFDFRE